MKIFGADMTTLIIPNEEVNDIMKIIKYLEEADLLIKGVSKAIEDETKEKKRWTSRHVIRYTSASLLGKLLKGKGFKQSQITR